MLDTGEMSERLRALSINPSQQRILISRLKGSDQEGDFSEPTNCDGLGRVRHFGQAPKHPWPPNPLPLEPAAASLGCAGPGPTTAQVFQNASCNWRCWYCYVPFDLLAAHPTRSSWRTAGELVDLWRALDDPSPILDLSGGQPHLVPEWVVWTMRALREQGLEKSTYLWSDDNLSTDYLWRFLSDDDLELLATYESYGRAICFKGIDPHSFSLNTMAAPALFEEQFRLAGRVIDLRVDTYAYVTITNDAPESEIPDLVNGLLDRLQDVHELLPLRTVPLEIALFGPVLPRIREQHQRSLRKQLLAVEAWSSGLEARFSSRLRATPMTEIPLSRR